MRIRKEEENNMHRHIPIEKKSKIKYRLAALFMTVCLVLLAACGGNGGSAPEGSNRESSVETLGDVNPIPEDGVITKEQFETVAGENREIQFTGESDGISYVWTFNTSQIQNPEDQNLKITFTTEGLDNIKDAANNANDALKMTMEGQGLICVPTLTVTLPESWQSDTGLLLKEQNGSLATMSDVTIDSQPQEEGADNTADASDTANGNTEESTDADEAAPVAGTTTLTMTVTSLDGDCYIVGGITGAQNKGADAANSVSGSSAAAGEETGTAESSATESGSGTDSASGNGSVSGGNSGNGASAQDDTSAGNNSSGSGDIKNDDVANDTSTLTCTISISCSTILNNMDNLTQGKEEFVPSDGWILPATTVEFSEGDSVHDVLQAVCKANGIHMESTYTPMYDSAYVEGINQLYEFDCGELSGWMYNVNGWFPNYGCSKYTVSDGDVINWVYTCDLGKDVGDNSMY